MGSEIAFRGLRKCDEHNVGESSGSLRTLAFVLMPFGDDVIWEFRQCLFLMELHQSS